MILRLLTILLVVAVVAAALVWLFGPREPVDLAIRFDPAAIGPDPDTYLARTEAAIPDLRADAVKQIVWAYPASRARTPLAIVYFHGFAGSKNELRPLPDEVARRLGANLFLARLTGHGSVPSALAETSVNDWLNDYAEALAIGRQIGERVVVMGLSTGATVATLAATLPGQTDDVAGFVEISPNFAIRDWRSFILTLPFARDAFRAVSYEVSPVGTEPETNRATGYPNVALLPMAALVQAARRSDVEAIRPPALFLYSRQDQVVDPAATEAVIARWGGPHRALMIEDSGDPVHHVLAGNRRSPGTTDRVAADIADWIRGLPAE